MKTQTKSEQRKAAGGHTYTVAAGRMIEKNGMPFVTIHRCESNFPPTEADDFTREAVRAVNSHADLVAANAELRKGLKLIIDSDTFRGGTFVKELQDIAREALENSDALEKVGAK